jgi:hypothetical protein
MAQAEQLWVARYLPAASADTLQPVIRIDYSDDSGDALGFLELFRKRGAVVPPVYLMRTGRTVVFGEVYGPLAARARAPCWRWSASMARGGWRKPDCRKD